jgi:hypothetical protein
MFLLWFFENRTGWLVDRIRIFGKVPFLFYVAHLYLLHILAVIVFFIKGHGMDESLQLIFGQPNYFVIPGEGFSLTIVYLIWIALVIMLFPVCKRFSDLKSVSKSGWLSYL